MSRSFSEDEDEREGRTSEPVIEDSPVYADDPDDNDFNKCLIIATEHGMAFSLLLELEQRYQQGVSLGQYLRDRLDDELERYRGREEPALAEFIKWKQEILDTYEISLENTKNLLADAATKSQQGSTLRRQALTRLYTVSQRFITRFLRRGPQLVSPRIEIDQEFCATLVELIHQDHWVMESQNTLKEIRRQLLRESTGPSNPFQRNDKLKRRRLLARVRAREEQLQIQRQSQLEKEQEFFLGVVHRLLLSARIVPDRDSSVSSGDSGSLSPMEQNVDGGKEQGNSPLMPDEAEPPKLQEVFERKAELAKAIDALEDLRSSYATQLANFLVTFTDQSKARFDGHWERDLACERYEVQEAAAIAAVTAAEAAYEVVLQEAQEAGITPLPPSPRDTGNRSEDGAAGSENTVVHAQRSSSKHKPGTRAWIKDVAKSGSPISPSTAPIRPGGEISKLPKGNVKQNFGFIGECKPKRTRIDRYENHQKAMQKRFKEMEEQRKGREDGRAAAAATAVVPTPEPMTAEARNPGWWCGVQ